MKKLPPTTDPLLPVEPFRPTRRPSIARLTIFDDGTKDGEIIRLRADEYSIGRTEGSIQICNDPLIDNPHVCIQRECHNKSYRWIITDLDSRTGLWMRVRKIELRNDTEFLLGRGRYRYRDATAELYASMSSLEARLDRGSLLGQSLDTNLNGFSSTYSTLELFDVTATPTESSIRKIFLIDDEYWIGRDSSCVMRSSSDTFLMAKHARVFHESTKWFAESLPGPNGMWIRTRRIVVENASSFQIGEQRFRLTCRLKDEDF